MSGDPPKAKPGSPFAALAGLRERLPAAPVAPAASPSPGPAPAAPKGPARAVIRYERKGRRGKETTVIDKLGLAPGELERWCQDLKRALGCGGGVEGEQIVLQGDQRPRLAPLLEARGVRKVTGG